MRGTGTELAELCLDGAAERKNRSNSSYDEHLLADIQGKQWLSYLEASFMDPLWAALSAEQKQTPSTLEDVWQNVTKLRH